MQGWLLGWQEARQSDKPRQSALFEQTMAGVQQLCSRQVSQALSDDTMAPQTVPPVASDASVALPPPGPEGLCGPAEDPQLVAVPWQLLREDGCGSVWEHAPTHAKRAKAIKTRGAVKAVTREVCLRRAARAA